MSDPLSTWSDGSSKEAILTFVGSVTDAGQSTFVRPEDRVATFDADGTLWCEKPVQVQMDFILRRLAALAEKDPPLRKQQPWKAAYEKDRAWFSDTVVKHYNGDDSGVKVLLAGVIKAFGNMTVEAFATQAAAYFKTARHPTYNVSYLELTYQPMVMLLGYLSANDFTTYIVSGGGRDFLRPVTQRLYGIPPERVVGSAFTESFQDDDRGAHIMRGAGIDFVDDGPAKAVHIWDRIGRRPILAAGNANGDIPMLQFAESKDHQTLRLLVNHDDAARETNYIAGAEKAMKMAQERGWTVISMKNDWSEVFGWQ